MGYKYKYIDKRRQESPFLILERNIYENLNVGTLAKVVETYAGGCKLRSIPKGEDMNCSLSLTDTSYSRGDIVVVLFLDNYGTGELDDNTRYILHDYRNAIILGKIKSIDNTNNS